MRLGILPRIARPAGMMVKTKAKKRLWRTRVSILSTHHSLPDSLGIMLASAAPFLGRDVAAPVSLAKPIAARPR